MIKVETFPPHKCGGSHQEAHSLEAPKKASSHILVENGGRVTTAGLKSKHVHAKPRKRATFQPGTGRFAQPAKRTLVLGLVLVVATLVLYYPAIHHPFVNYDDDGYVTENVHVQAGLNWDTVEWGFTSYDLANWHPLTWLSHALDCQFFQLDPAGHHGTNLVLHALNAALLFWILRQATGFMGRSIMVAALFALHPVNVESVVWVAERKNLLSMLFFLLALGAYRWYAREPRPGRYSVVAFLFALGLMAKPQVITLPFVLLLWDYWPLRRMFATDQEPFSAIKAPDAIPARSFSQLLLEKLPLVALSAISAVITMKAQLVGGGFNPDVSLSARLANAIVSYARYVAKAFWPARLVPMYPHPGNSLPKWEVLSALLFLLMVTELVTAARRRRYLPVGWLWFLGTLIPMIGLVQVGKQAMADRYAYLPFIGLFLMICWGVADCVVASSQWLKGRRGEVKTASAEAAATSHLISTRPAQSEMPQGLKPIPKMATSGTAEAVPFQGRIYQIPFSRQPISAILLATVCAGVLLALTVVAHRQIDYWKDNVTLWSRTLQVTSGNYEAEEDLGEALQARGEQQEAMTHFYKAVAIRPSFAISHMNIGFYDQQHGQLPEAIEQYQIVIRATQSLPQQNSGIRASAFANLGHAYLDLGNLTQAQESLQAAVGLNPQKIGAWLDLGLARQKSKNFDGAIQSYSEGMKIQPTDVGYLLLARALEQTGRKDEAATATQRAKVLSRNFTEAQRVAERLLAQ
jgi:tetratricopeptide (TPR) repeat protein